MTIEKWYYGGQRLSDKKLYHAWLPHGADSFSLFQKFEGHTIGAQYSVDVTRADGKVTVVQRSLTYLPDEPQHANTTDWRANDAAERALHAARQRQDKLKREGRDLGDLTLNEIAAAYCKMVGAHKPALIAQVLSRIMRGEL